MRINFYSAHMRTLSKLQELADKHNCCISFGFDSSRNDEEVSRDILEYEDFPEDVLNAIDDSTLWVYNIRGDYSNVWFELFDERDDTYHILEYASNYLDFTIDSDDCICCVGQSSIDFMEDLCLEDSLADNEYRFILDSTSTYITGFGFKERTQTPEVYRSGMALKFFSDRVCDYLGEPRIEETY